ncbi:MAG: type II toxin-antitoxin system Phd/YefM family antitoxin [Gammaproteobacteria bacterium]
MQTLTANEAKTHFGEFIDKAQREPVKVTRRGRTVGIMVSEEEYESMRQYYANRLLYSLDKAGKESLDKGLTESKLKKLLEDES